jgi:hypothetical protein
MGPTKKRRLALQTPVNRNVTLMARTRKKLHARLLSSSTLLLGLTLNAIAKVHPKKSRPAQKVPARQSVTVSVRPSKKRLAHQKLVQLRATVMGPTTKKRLARRKPARVLPRILFLPPLHRYPRYVIVPRQLGADIARRRRRPMPVLSATARLPKVEKLALSFPKKVCLKYVCSMFPEGFVGILMNIHVVFMFGSLACRFIQATVVTATTRRKSSHVLQTAAKALSQAVYVCPSVRCS